MSVIITGMHRSGTSMIARMLNLSGLYLGTTEQLLPPQADNPEGFWELEKVTEINNAVLKVLGGSWDQPPRHNLKDFQGKVELEFLKSQAREVVADFAEYEPWGWKDPRTCLTLEFWREFIDIDKLKVVICLRNPVDITKSLTARNTPIRFAYHLWDQYYQVLQQNLEGIPYIITHYDSYFYDKQTELKRLLDFLEINVTEEKFKEACGSLKTTLRNHVSTVVDLAETDAPLDIIEHYLELAQQAGPVFEELLARQENNNPTKSLKISAPLSIESQNAILAMRNSYLKNQLEAAHLETHEVRSQLETEINRLNVEYRKLHTAYEQQVGINNEQRQSFDRAQANSNDTYAKLEGAYKDLMAEYKRLANQSEHLQQENNQLAADLRALQATRTVRVSRKVGSLFQQIRQFSKR